MLTNYEDLSDDNRYVLHELIRDFPMIYEPYMIKESFRDIYRMAVSYDEAGKMFDLWSSAIPQYEEFSKMKALFFSRKNHILNYWYHPWTNGYTESVNRRIEIIEKTGHGYDFVTLRNKQSGTVFSV